MGLGVQDPVQLWEMTLVHKIFHVSLSKESNSPTAKEEVGMNGFEGVQADIFSEHDNYLLQVSEIQEVMRIGLGLVLGPKRTWIRFLGPRRTLLPCRHYFLILFQNLGPRRKTFVSNNIMDFHTITRWTHG